MPRLERFDIFAVASFGGHLEQLLEMRDAWSGGSCLFITTRKDPVAALMGEPVACVEDCHSSQLWKAAVVFRQLLVLFSRHRPRCLVTTGAMPGLIAAAVARLTGCRVIWIDSVANAERLSSSGRLARLLAHRHFSQWPDVAAREGTDYIGSLF